MKKMKMVRRFNDIGPKAKAPNNKNVYYTGYIASS